MSTSFCKRSTPQIREVLESKIEEKQAKLKEICGSRPFDPESPIHKAWEDYASANPELIPQLSRLNEIIKPLRERGMNSITITGWVYKMSYLEKDEIGELSFDQNITSVFEPDQLMKSFYSIKEILEQLARSDYEFNFRSDGSFKFIHHGESSGAKEKRKAYDSLEKSRQIFLLQLEGYKAQLGYLEHPIESFPNDIRDTQCAHPIEEQAQALKQELIRAFSINIDLLLSECLEKINKCLVENDQDANSLKKIQSLINASSQSADIWNRLWLEKGKNESGEQIIEDSWAEKHFHKFLPALRVIVLNCRAYVRNLTDETPTYLQD